MARALYQPIDGHCARCKKALAELVTCAITLLQPERTFLQKFPFFPYHDAFFCPECKVALGLAQEGIFVPVEKGEELIDALKRMITTVKTHIQERAEAKKASDAAYEKTMANAAAFGAKSIQEAIDKDIAETLVRELIEDERKENMRDGLLCPHGRYGGAFCPHCGGPG